MLVVVPVVVGVAVAAVFTGLLYLSDNPRLPSRARLQHDGSNETPRGGYDLADIAAPRVAGWELRFLAWLTRSPVIGRLVCRNLYDKNKMIQVRRLASRLPDQPLYYPLVDPSHVDATSSTEVVDLVSFGRKRATTKPGSTGGFCHRTISDFTARYAAGELSPVQVARAVLAAVDQSEWGQHPLRIFVERHDEDVLTQARASAERYAQGKPLGVLDGVPVAVKDEMDVQGFKLFAGTSFLGDLKGVAQEDALPIARLRAQGAIIVGKTNMHEVGSGVTGFNMTYGTPRNPYNPSHYPGGSSSGSAVAVAAGIVPLAIGLDAGGSIRIPAGLCGVVGLKATFSRIPPVCNDCPSLAHVGPLTGSVRDAAIAYAVMSGSHESVARSLIQPTVSLDGFEETASLEGLKIGYFPEYMNHSSPDIASASLASLQSLEARGAELVEVQLEFLQAIHFAHNITVSTELAQHLDAVFSEFSKISPEAQILLSFARNFTSTDFLAAQRLRSFALRQLQEKIFSKVDVFITPTTATTAPRIPADALSYGELDTVALGKIMRYSVYANFVGNPGIAVPIGYDSEGLPISLQIQSCHYEEAVMLRVAHAVETIYFAEQKQPQVYFSIIDAAASQPKT